MIGVAFVALLASSGPEAARSQPGFQRNVAVLVFDGVELLDFARPVEAFSQTRGWDTPLRVYTVGIEKRPMRTNNVATVVPDFTIADCPPPDVLAIAGGETACVSDDGSLAPFVSEQVPKVENVLSVCNGASSPRSRSRGSHSAIAPRRRRRSRTANPTTSRRSSPTRDSTQSAPSLSS